MKDLRTDKSMKVLLTKVALFEDSAQELIKTASFAYDELDALPSTSFAWPEMRKLAMHTKEHTAISMIYAEGEDLPVEVRARLEKTASLYGIDLNRKEIVKTASVDLLDDGYALFDEDKTRFKLASAESISLGEMYLKKNRKHLTIEKIAEAHRNIITASEKFGKEVSFETFRNAGMAHCDREKLAEHLEVRSAVVKAPAHKESFLKLAEAVLETEVASRIDLIKVASAIATLDREAGLEKDYDKKLLNPLMSVFNTEKVAGVSLTLANKSVDLTELSARPVSDFASVLGEDIEEEIVDESGDIDPEKLHQVLITLPADLQSALVMQLGV